MTRKPKRKKAIAWSITFMSASEESVDFTQVFVTDKPTWTKFYNSLSSECDWKTGPYVLPKRRTR